METILKMNNITKLYKTQKALDDFNINIEKGDIYGFVGENGSGKTTVIRLISGLIYQNKGDFELFGVNCFDKQIDKTRKKLGAIVEAPSIYLNMSAYDNLKMQCILLNSDEKEIPSVLEYVGLQELLHSNKSAKNFSLGMRQRLGIAMCLIGNPEFIILDEPMNGLDPAGIVEIRELILKLNHEKNITFLISSHILTELSLVANKYGIISKGHMIKEISSKELENECRKSVAIKSKDVNKLNDIFSKFVPKENIELFDNEIKIYDIDVNLVIKVINDEKMTIESIKSSDANIEDYYLSLIGGVKHA